jgi:hypothetical protein
MTVRAGNEGGGAEDAYLVDVSDSNREETAEEEVE